MGQSGNKGVAQDEATTSEVAEDTEAESTDADVERVCGAERNEDRAMWS